MIATDITVALWISLAIVLAVGVVGCGGGPPSSAWRAVSVTASGLAQADREIAGVYGQHADRCRVESSTMAAYRACMDALDQAVLAIGAARSGTLAAQSTLDTWERTDDGQAFFNLIPCWIRTLLRMQSALVDAGWTIPSLLNEGLGLLQIWEGECHVSD